MKKLFEILAKIFSKPVQKQPEQPKLEQPTEVLRSEAEPIKPAPELVKESVKKTLKLALVVGHEARAKGAKAVSGIHEYDFFRMVASQVKDRLKDSHVDVEEFLRDGRGIRGTIRAAKQWGADVCIELHYNSFNKTAAGSEALVVEKNNKLAKDCNDEWCKQQGINNRGLKIVMQGQNGFASVDEIKNSGMRGFLWEPFFGDNKDDYRNPAQVSDFLSEWSKKIR